MDTVSATSLLSPSTDLNPSNSVAGLGSPDFLKLLVAQLTNQDPLEPTDNKELLAQISSIREIELSTTLTESLQTLTGQQRFASASTLIGQYVTGMPDAEGAVRSGLVVGVRFSEGGQPVLLLADGSAMSLEQISTIESALQAAESLIGLKVIGLDRRDPSEPELVEGVVTAVRVDERGEVVLELDSGDNLRFKDIVGAGEEAAV